jgi:hypothetical protein
MDITHQEGEWIATMTVAEAQDADSPMNHALATVAQEYAVSRSQITSRVVRYHKDGVTVVVSRADGQL